MRYTSKPLAFPEVTDLAALFVEIKPEKRFGLTYCSVRSHGRASAWVRPTPQVVTYIDEHMMTIVNGHVHFQFVERDDGTVLVTCDWDHILGGRWLALVPATELDKYLPKEE